jgi:hypothetical protein
MLAFFTDADLSAARLAHNCQALVATAMATAEIGPLLAECAFVPLRSGFAAAHNSVLDKCIGPGWVPSLKRPVSPVAPE